MMSRYTFQWTLPVALLAAVSLLFPAHAQSQQDGINKQFLQPPAPEDPGQDLNHPPTVAPGDDQAIEVLPDVPLAFRLRVGDLQVPEHDWNVQGTVEAVGNNQVQFTTEDEQSALLLYRIPEGLRDPFETGLEPGSPIRVFRTNGGSSFPAPEVQDSQKGFGIDPITPSRKPVNAPFTEVSSGERLLISAGALQSDVPQEVIVGGGIMRLLQGDERLSVQREGQFETVYNVPVDASVEDPPETFSLNLFESTTVAVGNFLFTALILDSSEIVPAPEAEGFSEGDRYRLRYVVVPQPIIR